MFDDDDNGHHHHHHQQQQHDDDHREIYNIFTLCAKTSSPLSATI